MGLLKMMSGGLLSAGLLAAAPLSAGLAEEKKMVPPPPYQMAGANTVTIAVQWDAATVDKLLPAGLKAVDGHTGGVNVYTAPNGFGLTPYSAAYAYVSVQGFDSADGTKARFILQGYYGPNPGVAKAMRTHFGSDVATGESSQRGDSQRWEGVGMAGGREVMRVAVKPKGGDCPSIGGTLNYVGVKDGHAGFALMQIPYIGNFCAGDPLQLTLSGSDGDAFDSLKAVKLLGGGQLKNGIFAFTAR